MAARAHLPRKRFGQNFLHDAHVVERILAAINPRPGEHLVEIGPGHGALTLPLAERCGALTAIELDRDLAGALQARNVQGLSVLTGDALAFDFTEFAAGRRLRIVGNLPYNISTPLLFHVFTHAGAIVDMHFMLQREVVDRMVAAPGSRTYGRLSVMVALHCAPERVLKVRPGAFTPAPKVDSAVVRLTPHAVPPVDVGDRAMFDRVVSALFSKRRKTARNGLLGILDADAIGAAGVDPGARPETLSLASFAALGRAATAAAR